MPKDFALNRNELFVAGPITPLGKHVRVFALKNAYPCNAYESDFTFLGNVGPNNPKYTRLLVGTDNNQYVVEDHILESLANKLYKLNLRVNYEGLCYFLTKSRVDLTTARNDVQFYRINDVLDWSSFNARNPEDLASQWNRCFIGMNRTYFDFVKYDSDYKKKVDALQVELKSKDKEWEEKVKELEKKKDKELQEKLKELGEKNEKEWEAKLKELSEKKDKEWEANLKELGEKKDRECREKLKELGERKDKELKEKLKEFGEKKDRECQVKLKDLGEKKDKEWQAKINAKDGTITKLNRDLSNPFSMYKEIILRRKVRTYTSELKFRTDQRYGTMDFYSVGAMLLTPEDLNPDDFKEPGRDFANPAWGIPFAGSLSLLDYGNWWKIKVKEYPYRIIFYAGDFGGFMQANRPLTYNDDGLVGVPHKLGNGLWNFDTDSLGILVNKGLLLGFGYVYYIYRGIYKFKYSFYEPFKGSAF